MIREYPIGSETKPGGDTIWFTLIFDEQGEMYVEMCHDFNQPAKNDKMTHLRAENFDKFTVNGVSLRQLVVRKLSEILPS